MENNTSPAPLERVVGPVWHIWSKDHGVINIHDLLPMEFVEIQEAARFVGVSGRRADELVSNENGNLFVIDSCGGAHAVDPLRFVAIPPNPQDQRAGLPGSDVSTCWARSAQLFATKYHHGQFRRDGITPYIQHPAAVAASFESDYCQAVSWLHDVLEDTNADIGDLAACFPDEIVDAVMAITKRDGQDYQQYLEQVAANPLAKAVKIADIKHNLSDYPTVKQIEKYTKALRFLEPNTTISGKPSLPGSDGLPSIKEIDQ